MRSALASLVSCNDLESVKRKISYLQRNVSELSPLDGVIALCSTVPQEQGTADLEGVDIQNRTLTY